MSDQAQAALAGGGWVIGLLSAASLLVLALPIDARIRPTGHRIGTAGLATVAGAVLAMWWRGESGTVVASLVAATGTAAVAAPISVSPLATSSLALPATVWLLTGAPTVPSSVAVGACGVAAAAIGLGVESERRIAEPRIVAVLLLVSSVGLYLAVPDTEEAIVLVGAVTALTAASVLRRRPVGAAGMAGLVVLYAWTMALGARGRPSTVVGASLALGVLVWLPVACRLVGRAGHRGAPAAMVAVHLVAVALAARVVAPLEGAIPLAVASVVLVLGQLAALVALAARSSRR